MQNQIQEALVAAERVVEILELEEEKDNSVKYMKPLREVLKFPGQNIFF